MIRISVSSLIVALTLASCGRPSADQSQSDLTASSASLVKRFYGPNIPAELCLVYQQDPQSQTEASTPAQITSTLVGYLKYKGPTGANRFKSFRIRDEIGELSFVQTHRDGRRLEKPFVSKFNVGFDDVEIDGYRQTAIVSIQNDQTDNFALGRTLLLDIFISKHRDLFGRLTIGYRRVTKHADDHYAVVCRTSR
ncbi:MAG: hypothetical protein NT027_18645 [Proteobacteria bacterium]|nr:hypothetical protein [Pseudomonadota bacterium]